MSHLQFRSNKKGLKNKIKHFINQSQSHRDVSTLSLSSNLEMALMTAETFRKLQLFFSLNFSLLI